MAKIAANEPDPTVDELLARREEFGDGAFYSIGEAMILADELIRLRKTKKTPQKGGAAK